MGPGSGRNSTRPFGYVRNSSLVAKNQKRLAAVLYRSALSSAVLFRHALRVQGVGNLPAMA
jgi:hypothetical protein